MTVLYIDKVNQRVIGSELQIFSESHQIGITSLNTPSPDFIRLIEVPLLETPSTVVIPGFSEVSTLPGVNEFKVDYTNGRILFHPSRNTEFVSVTYKGRGSIVDAEDINELQQVLGPIGNLDGTLSDGVVTPSTISTVVTDDFTFPRNVTVTGDLTVTGTFTSLQTETVTVDDNILQLNSNATGAPTENAGIEIERGSSNNVNFLWNETLDGWQSLNSVGTSILTALDTLRVGINTDVPAATLHVGGSTVFGVDTATDPGSITVAQVDDFSGIIVTTTGAVVLTMPTPTNATAGRFFTIVHNDTSSGSLTLDGKSVNVGQGTTLMWDGTVWTPVGGGAGGFSLVAGDPVSPSQGDTWFDTITEQFKGYNGTEIVLLG